MMTPAVCAGCGMVLRFRAEQVEERRELRNLGGLRFVRSWRSAVYCRSCAEVLAAGGQAPVAAGDEQRGLW